MTDPAPVGRSQQRRIGIVLGLNASMVAGLVVVGSTAHSLAVLGEAGDVIADSAALLLGLLAIRMRDRPRSTARPTTIVALVNAVALLVVCVLVVIGAADRLAHHAAHVHGVPVLVVSAVVAVVMGVGALVLGRSAGSEDLHMRSVLLDTVADAVTAGVVALSGLVIALTDGLAWLDSVAAIAVALPVAAAAIRLLRDAVRGLGEPVDAGRDGAARHQMPRIR